MPNQYTPTVMAALRAARRRLGARSPEMFALVYLAAAFSRPGGRMHREVFAALADLSQRGGGGGGHLAIAAPRGHAKSTVVTLAYVLWCLLYQRERFVLVVSGTQDQASKLLDHVKRQVEGNRMILEDFPEVAGWRRISPWRRDSILLPNGAMAMSYSAHQNLRGARHGKDRPTLIIADDLEDKAAVVSEEQRQKLEDWFNSTLLKAGTPDTNVVVVGTVLHQASLLAGLLDPGRAPGWKRLCYRAVESFSQHPELWERWQNILTGQGDWHGQRGEEAAQVFYKEHETFMLEGTRVLWPQVYDYKALMTIRLREGEASFGAEFQNEPLDPDVCLFAGTTFTYWDDRHACVEDLLQSLGTGGVFYGACDPSLGGDPGRGDYSAIVILYRPRLSRSKYVIVADLARRKPDALLDRIVEYARLYTLSSFAVEANQFQELLVDRLRERAKAACVRLNVVPVRNRANKQQRIAALQSEISQGTLVLARRHQLLTEQLRAFPVGKHDDGPDALEMAVANCESLAAMFEYFRQNPGRFSVTVAP